MTVKGRPELGELTVGQDVMVVRSPNDSRRRIPARITKVNRVWIEMQKVDGRIHESWRMRRDDQTEGTQYSGSDASFLTMEQYAWTETRHWALSVLAENKITVDLGSPWIGREAELADLIVKAGEKNAARQVRVAEVWTKEGEQR